MIEAEESSGFATLVSKVRAAKLARHYKRLFNPDGALSRDAEIVLHDLREMLFARRAVWDPDPDRMRENATLQRVWLRFERLLGLDEETIRTLVEIDYGDDGDF